MMRISVFLTIASLLSVVNLSFAGEFVHFESQPDSKVKAEFVYISEESVSILQCARKCARNESCSSVSYNENDGVCHLSEQRIIGPDNADMVTTEQSWTSLSKKEDNGEDPPTAPCNVTGQVRLGNKCYIFKTGYYTHYESMAWCRNKPVEPQTLSSFEDIRQYLLQVYPPHSRSAIFWTGLIRVNNEYVWESSMLPPSYNGFTPGLTQNDDCVFFASYRSYKFEARPCTLANMACEE